MKSALCGFALVSLAGSLSLLGCLAPEDDSAEVEEVDAEEEIYTVTIVDLDQGGAVIEQHAITKTEQEANRKHDEELARAGLGSSSDALSHDSNCSSNIAIRLSLYDQANYGGNVICFTGTGTFATLANYCRVFNLGGCYDYWNDEVRSYRPGAESMQLSVSSACGSACANTSTSSPNAGSCGTTAEYVWRADIGCDVG